MSVTHGADVEGLRASARELADTAQALLTVNVRLSHRVYDLTWNGPDARRFRDQWEAEYAPALGRVSSALNHAASEIAEQAAEQERASGAEGATSSATDDLQARLNLQRDVLGVVAGLAQVGRAALAHPDAWRTMQDFNRAWDVVENFHTPLQKAAAGTLGVLGTFVNAHGLVKGATEGDYAAIAQNGVPLVAQAVLAAGTGAAVSGAWGAGTLIGTGINNAMEDTTYGDRVSENFDALYEATSAVGPLGSMAAGVVLTPVVLAKSGLDLLLGDGEPPIP